MLYFWQNMVYILSHLGRHVFHAISHRKRDLLRHVFHAISHIKCDYICHVFVVRREPSNGQSTRL
jgi:hypothetical protein